jgi:hypothetical protein
MSANIDIDGVRVRHGGSPQQSRTFEAARDLLHLMTVRVATSDPKVSRHGYDEARTSVLGDSRAVKLAPDCVRRCRTPDEVWSYIKSRDLPTYESRQQFLGGEFEPLLSALERFDSSPLDELVTTGTRHLDSASVSAAWGKAIERRGSDPEGAITAARSLLESTCKTVLDDRNEAYGERDDLPALYKRVQKALTLAPSDHTEEQFRAILGACATIVKELGSLRNRISDSHAPGRKVYRPAERHAALAVNLTGSMALFLMETHEARETAPVQTEHR